MRLYLRSRDRRPDPEPLHTNDRATVLAGMAAWAALWAVAILAHERLSAADHGWWIWTPPAGIALGIVGLIYIKAHQRRR